MGYYYYYYYFPTHKALVTLAENCCCRLSFAYLIQECKFVTFLGKFYFKNCNL